MRISNSYNYNIGQYNSSIPKNPKVSLVPNSHISFCSRVKTKQVNFALSHGLEKLKTFSTEEYKSLSEAELKAIRSEYEKLVHRDRDVNYLRCEQMHSKTADSIRQTLDGKYGKDKYVVITIGRSLSSIGKALGYQIGEENVINLPMSQAGKYLLERYVKSIEADGEIDVLRGVLAKQGLTKDAIQKSGKQYVIMDYCCSGESLKGAKELLTRHDVLGNKQIKSMDVAKCVKNKAHAEALCADLFSCKYKDFAFVSESHSILEMKYAYLHPEKADLDTKLFWFKILDNEMTKKTKSQKTGFSLFFEKLKNYFI